MAGRRDEEHRTHCGLMLPADLHRVHAPEDDPAAHAERRLSRDSRRRLFPWLRRNRAGELGAKS